MIIVIKMAPPRHHPAPGLPARAVLYFVHEHRRAPLTRIPRVADDPAERSFRGDPANVVRAAVEQRCQSSPRPSHIIGPRVIEFRLNWRCWRRICASLCGLFRHAGKFGAALRLRFIWARNGKMCTGQTPPMLEPGKVSASSSSSRPAPQNCRHGLPFSRISLGRVARRAQIVGMLLIEAIVATGAGGAIGVAFGVLLLRLFERSLVYYLTQMGVPFLWPSIAIMSSKAGMATISLDFSATATCPSTRRWRAAKAETMWIGSFEPLFW
jgi:hypothetical protein